MFVVAVRFLSSWAAAVDIISAALKKKKNLPAGPGKENSSKDLAPLHTSTI